VKVKILFEEVGCFPVHSFTFNKQEQIQVKLWLNITLH